MRDKHGRRRQETLPGIPRIFLLPHPQSSTIMRIEREKQGLALCERFNRNREHGNSSKTAGFGAR
jgi:hypothetical protein